ncbi:MAG: YfbK domain-containing protein [Segetibacter sp.]
MVRELTQTLYAVADDVIITATFNPQKVSGYRLIGFDNQRTALSDTTSRLKGGEIGSGHSLMVLFEAALTSQNLQVNDLIADVSISYKLPLHRVEQATNYRCLNNSTAFDKTDSSLKKLYV